MIWLKKYVNPYKKVGYNVILLSLIYIRKGTGETGEGLYTGKVFLASAFSYVHAGGWDGEARDTFPLVLSISHESVTRQSWSMRTMCFLLQPWLSGLQCRLDCTTINFLHIYTWKEVVKCKLLLKISKPSEVGIWKRCQYSLCHRNSICWLCRVLTFYVKCILVFTNCHTLLSPLWFQV